MQLTILGAHHRLFRPHLLVLTIILALVLGLSALSLSAAPDTGAVFVSPAGADSNDCFTLATPCRSITVAISKAVAGDAVLIASGLYTDSFTLDKPLTLIGYGPEQPIVQAVTSPLPHRVLTVTTGVGASIDNISIERGNSSAEATPYGGGILNAGVLTLTHASMLSNTSFEHGGGIANLSGTLTLINSTVGNNRVLMQESGPDIAYGAGIANLGGLVRIVDSTVLSNTLLVPHFPFDGCGGGVANVNGTLNLSASDVRGNSATEGGGLYNSGTMLIDQSRVSDNNAPTGAGIFNNGTITLNRSLVSKNTAYCSLNTGSTTVSSPLDFMRNKV